MADQRAAALRRALAGHAWAGGYLTRPPSGSGLRYPIAREPNWPSVGSAQQNHGSVSRGLPSTDPGSI